MGCGLSLLNLEDSFLGKATTALNEIFAGWRFPSSLTTWKRSLGRGYPPKPKRLFRAPPCSLFLITATYQFGGHTHSLPTLSSPKVARMAWSSCSVPLAGSFLCSPHARPSLLKPPLWTPFSLSLLTKGLPFSASYFAALSSFTTNYKRPLATPFLAFFPSDSLPWGLILSRALDQSLLPITHLLSPLFNIYSFSLYQLSSPHWLKKKNLWW